MRALMHRPLLELSWTHHLTRTAEARPRLHAGPGGRPHRARPAALTSATRSRPLRHPPLDLLEALHDRVEPAVELLPRARLLAIGAARRNGSVAPWAAIALASARFEGRVLGWPPIALCEHVGGVAPPVDRLGHGLAGIDRRRAGAAGQAGSDDQSQCHLADDHASHRDAPLSDTRIAFR
jgi:hypothetical protein